MASEEIISLIKSSAYDDVAASALVVNVLRNLNPTLWTEEAAGHLVATYQAEHSGPVELDAFLAWIFGPPRGAQARTGPEVIFVLGGPGSGKGTFSQRITEQFGFRHLSAGDLIRAEKQRPGSAMAGQIETCLKNGQLIPSEVTIGLLGDEMRRQGWDEGKYLIDGFPRSIGNYQTWDRLLGDSTRLTMCLIIDCSEAVMLERLLNRGKTSGRSDDNAESIKKRFALFQAETVPVQELMAKKGLVRRVCSDPGIENMWHEVEAIFRAAEAAKAKQGSVQRVNSDPALAR